MNIEPRRKTDFMVYTAVDQEDEKRERSVDVAPCTLSEEEVRFEKQKLADNLDQPIVPLVSLVVLNFCPF
jgi:hypothetical protein